MSMFAERVQATAGNSLLMETVTVKVLWNLGGLEASGLCFMWFGFDGRAEMGMAQIRRNDLMSRVGYEQMLCARGSGLGGILFENSWQ